jgi:hypothetical protein
LKLWDREGREVFQHRQATGRIEFLAFDPSGTKLYFTTAGNSQRFEDTVHVLDAPK